MKSRDDLEVTAQVRFGEDGEMKKDEEVDTSLDDWGIVEETEERETKYETESASEFGVDDRSARGEIDEGRQSDLVLRGAKGQKDLTGEEVGMQSNW